MGSPLWILQTNHHKQWIAPLCCAVIILIASIIPLRGGGHAVGIDTMFEIRMDVVLHIIGYAVLAWTIVNTQRFTPKNGRDMFIVIIFVIAYGIGIEGLQIMIPARQLSFTDILANTVGATSIYTRSVFDVVTQRYH
ncbi:VanZ family protein [Haloquadratum walsbyi]|uniref:Putative integral membrane protein n=1 Tax=Haloquadratum walsbyi J07HQW2 TaxID=1238425 RepID=U1N0D7_9EURY|nr:MAG: putative integral membrane protein [Haloquadratum walsbyi J07HQW2]